MDERWASFDCYGTLVDWAGGIGATFARLWTGRPVEPLLERYHELEPRVQLGTAKPYRQVLAEALVLLAGDEALPLAPEDEGALAETLPSWPVFAEVPGALAELRARGWRLAILSNTDPDLLAASLRRIGVDVDLTVTAADAGSYKPAVGHWNRFFEATGADFRRYVHVAASLYHDIAPAGELGLSAVWINRLEERSSLPHTAELPDLSALPDTLDELVPR